jgi:hypothetical protein
MIRRLRVLGCVAASLIPSLARGNIIGFGNFSGFTINQNDSGSPPIFPSPGTIELVNGVSEARSVVANAQQNVSQFTASFTYQVINPGQDEGAVFILENDPGGAAAVGTGNHGFRRIQNSVDVTFNIGDNNTGLFTDGNGFGGLSGSDMSPVSLASGDPINVQFTYANSTLTESLVDPVTSAHFSTTYSLSIPSTVGGSAAFVGITAGSSTDSVDQLFSNLQFSSTVTPEPAGLSVLVLTTLPLRRRNRRHN